MAKIAMVCPFSNKMCVDCAIYRGSHYYLCFRKDYRGCLLEGANRKAPKERTVYGVKNLEVDVPVDEIRTGGKVVSDIENVLEEEEFAQYNKRNKV
jgi:hypothetical protein